MGDNVFFNTALARALRVLRGKCLGHACDLVADVAVIPFYSILGTSFLDLVVKSGGIIFAGGTNKRKAELESAAFGLLASKLTVYANRFASAFKVNRYIVTNFEATKLFYTVGKSLNLDVNDEDEAEKDKAQKARTAAAYKAKDSKLLLKIVDIMYGDLPDTITHLSGAADHVDPRTVDHLLKIRRLYTARIADPAKTVTAACTALGITGPGSVAAAVAKFKDVVVTSARAAAAKWDAHFPDMIAYLRRRFFYTPSMMPPLPPVGGLNVDFYGCDPDELNTELDTEYREYVDERRSHRERYPDRWESTLADTAVPVAVVRKGGLAPFVEYWPIDGYNDGSGLSAGDPCYMTLKIEHRPASVDYWKVRRVRWSNLIKVSGFWIEFETSSIDAERVIAIVRKMGLPGRGSMSNETFQREIFLRVNRFAVEALLDEKRKAIVEFVK